MRNRISIAVVTALLAGLAVQASSSAPVGLGVTAEERAVLATDAEQRLAVATADVTKIDEISHANLRVNAPNNRILSKDDLIQMVGSGEIRNDVFERHPEQVVVTGNVAVVMGSEVVLPGPKSEQARLYGERNLTRRYTNVYVLTDGKWLHLARHANVIPPTISR